jgi:hypothetical protein
LSSLTLDDLEEQKPIQKARSFTIGGKNEEMPGERISFLFDEETMKITDPFLS